MPKTLKRILKTFGKGLLMLLIVFLCAILVTLLINIYKTLWYVFVPITIIGIIYFLGYEGDQ